MVDKNYISFNQNLAGDILLNGIVILPASMPGIREWIIDGDVVPPDGTFSDTIKIAAGCTRLRVIITGRVVGGIEDVVDINDAFDIEVVIARAEVRGKFLSTIKGGSDRISLTVGELIGRGSETDVDLGNYSDQSKARTKVVKLNVGRPNKQDAVRVRVLNGWDPMILNREQKYDISDCAKGIAGFILNLLKKLGFI